MSVHTSAFLLALVVPRKTRKISLLRLLPPTAQTPKASLVARKIRQPTEAVITDLWSLENSFVARKNRTSCSFYTVYTSLARSHDWIGVKFDILIPFIFLLVSD